MRRLATVIVSTGMLVVHLCVWGAVALSVQLLIVLIIPGVLYGLIFRMPRLS